MQLVTVFTAFNPVDADLVNSRLAAAGFHPEISHDLPAANIVGITLGQGGIAVQVPEDEIENAREFLADPGEQPPA